MKTLSITLVAVCSLSAARYSSAEDDATVTPPLVQTLAAQPFVIGADTSGYNRPVLPTDPPPQYAWGGFISQSWVKSSEGVRLSGPSDSRYGSFQRSEAGLFGTYSLNPYVDFRGMVSMFRDGRFEDGRPQINYGLVDVHDQDSDYGVRLGYISNSSGFFTDQLNVPSFRDMELAPQGLYRESYRHIGRGGRGAQIYLRLLEHKGWWASFEASHFRANVDDQEELSQAFFGNKEAAEFQRSSKFSTASVRLRNNDLGLVLRYDRNDLNLDATGKTNARYNGDHDLTIHRWGVRKYFTFGDITAERATFHFTSCGSVRCNYPWGQPIAADIMYRHYLTPTLNMIVGYDTYFLSKDDRSGRKYQQLFADRGVTVGRESRFAKTASVALQWKADSHWTYKAEYHRTNGTATMLATENDLRSPNLPKQYNVFILNAVFAF